MAVEVILNPRTLLASRVSPSPVPKSESICALTLVDDGPAQGAAPSAAIRGPKLIDQEKIMTRLFNSSIEWPAGGDPWLISQRPKATAQRSFIHASQGPARPRAAVSPHHRA